MRKTSIFSKNYEKILRRKKRIKWILSIIFVVIIILCGIICLNFDSFKKFIAGNHNKVVQEDKNPSNVNVDNTNKDNTNKKPNNTKEDIPKPSTDIEATAKLPNGTIVSYKIDKEANIIKHNSTPTGYTIEDASTQKFFLVFSNDTYELFLVNVDGTVKNLTYETFITTNGTRVHRKDKVAKDPSFIWMENPKVYKNKIFYATKLPNLNNGNRYFLWVCDIETGVHKGIYDKSLRGNEIVISGDSSEKGLEIKFDKVSKYFDVDEVSGEIKVSD